MGPVPDPHGFKPRPNPGSSAGGSFSVPLASHLSPTVATASAREVSIDQLRRLYRFMAERDYVASRQELIDQGFSQTRIKNWIRNGRLIGITRSVYSYGRDVQTLPALRRAALLAAGPESALTGRTACEAWEIVKPAPGWPRTIEIASPVGQAREFQCLSPALRGTSIKVARRDLGSDDVLSCSGLRTVRAAWALTDFAASADDRQVRFAFLEACRLSLFAQPDVTYCLVRLSHRRGARRLRPYLSLWVPELNRIRSVFEGWFLLVWIARGYPLPRVNARVCGREVDIYVPELGYVLELDGGAFHSDSIHMRIDREKQQHLEAQGLEVERLPFRVFERNPEGEVDRIARKLGYL